MGRYLLMGRCGIQVHSLTGVGVMVVGNQTCVCVMAVVTATEASDIGGASISLSWVPVVLNIGRQSLRADCWTRAGMLGHHGSQTLGQLGHGLERLEQCIFHTQACGPRIQSTMEWVIIIPGRVRRGYQFLGPPMGEVVFLAEVV